MYFILKTTNHPDKTLQKHTIKHVFTNHSFAAHCYNNLI